MLRFWSFPPSVRSLLCPCRLQFPCAANPRLNRRLTQDPDPMCGPTRRVLPIIDQEQSIVAMWSIYRHSRAENEGGADIGWIVVPPDLLDKRGRRRKLGRKRTTQSRVCPYIGWNG